jgi:hypothetical protein
MNRFTVLSAVLGFMCFVLGAALIYRPFGLLAAGGLFISLAIATARKKRNS